MIVHYHPSGLFSQSRCSLENWKSFQYDHINDKNPKTNKTGIRCHHFIIALILRFFGKIHIEKTKEGKSVYLNRKSFKKWIKWRGFSDQTATSTTTVEKIEQMRCHVVKTEPKNTSPLSTAASDFKQAIMDHCSEDLGKIWECLLACIPPDDIIQFESIEENTFTLKFSRPIALWLDSRSQDGTLSEPKGGTIVLLGHNERQTLEVLTDPLLKTIKYSTGMQFYCDTNTTGIGTKILNVISMSDKDEESVAIKAGCKVLFVFKAKEKIQPKKTLLKVWKQAAHLDREKDYRKYLERKMEGVSEP
ncbi:hypothetical protein [Waddlia chondrophila]|uniref:Uncharacterized protein n=1 Tax=Waddlia chondrophila (strain ATCC VR-1470 / WSU 86-1044) TaxID=716544 RepID=D6YWV5_WADCW|nr:hypothetical protein [Waddlia chondrophila]ADI38616.1 hypothetical protein wcw_1264 [Waddlia chondrophila WSU 86-1044]